MRDRPQREQHRARLQRPPAPPRESVAGLRSRAGVGLFCGGTHFTAFVMRQPTSRSPSSLETDRGAVLQPNVMQRFVEQDAGVVAGERAPGGVGAVEARREADDQQARVAIAERRHRRAVIRGMLRPALVEELREPRTGRAGLVELR